jgi:hypothetical protein
MHAPPSGVQAPHEPHSCFASSTQMLSQATSQQNASTGHTVPAHELQAGLSGVPSTHSSCSQTPAPQKPFVHCPLQQSEGCEQGAPPCTQPVPQTPPVHSPKQQSLPVEHS